MPGPVVAWVIGAALSSLLASLLWARWQHSARRSNEASEMSAYCIWCLYRRSGTCTHPGSPVYPDACRPVCDGELQCDARQQRQRW
jgi:hypothetical protein